MPCLSRSAGHEALPYIPTSLHSETRIDDGDIVCNLLGRLVPLIGTERVR
jgi:hypothetical protein